MRMGNADCALGGKGRVLEHAKGGMAMTAAGERPMGSEAQRSPVERLVHAAAGRPVTPATTVQRRWLAFTGAVTLAAGAGLLFAPVSLLVTSMWIVGGFLLGSAALTAGQWLIGLYQSGGQGAAGRPVIGVAVLNAALGFVFLLHGIVPAVLVYTFIVVLIGVEGGVLLFFAFRSPRDRPRVTMGVLGVVSLVVAAGVVLGWEQSREWVVWLFGGKLVLLGAAQLAVAFLTRDEDARLIFGAALRPGIRPEPGEVYAVLFGPAFHCGVCTGPDEMVDFRDDELVHRVSWDEFCRGRAAQHWEYPDLPEVPAEEVIALARSEVGNRRPYHGFKANCESFAIWCKSGGRETTSRYAQVALGVEGLSRSPLLGSVLEIVTRAVGYLAYLVGGVVGREVGFQVRWMAGRVTNWLALRAKRAEGMAADLPRR